MIPNGTRFIGISTDVDLTERRSKLINDMTEPFTIEEIREGLSNSYKSYTALLNQDEFGNIIIVSTLENTLGTVSNISGTFGNIVIEFVDPVLIENKIIGFTYSAGPNEDKYFGWVVVYQSPTNISLISSGVASGEQQKEIRVDIKVYN